MDSGCVSTQGTFASALTIYFIIPLGLDSSKPHPSLEAVSEVEWDRWG